MKTLNLNNQTVPYKFTSPVLINDNDKQIVMTSSFQFGSSV